MGYKNIDAKEFEEGVKNDPNAVIIDVRSPGEYEDGHIPHSKLINIMGPEFVPSIQKLPKEKAYYLYCRSGSRSASACGFMASQGFKELYNLDRGILDWEGPIE